jgi:hypothetical protein
MVMMPRQLPDLSKEENDNIYLMRHGFGSDEEVYEDRWGVFLLYFM